MAFALDPSHVTMTIERAVMVAARAVWWRLDTPAQVDHQPLLTRAHQYRQVCCKLVAADVLHGSAE